MKRIKSTISYVVPHWNFCNSDNLNQYGEITNKTCSFCIKEGQIRRCALYDTRLIVDGKLIEKTEACCRATSGFKSEIVTNHVEDTKHILPPKELVKSSIETYSQKLNELLTQGYPRKIAEMAAKKYTLGE